MRYFTLLAIMFLLNGCSHYYPGAKSNGLKHYARGLLQETDDPAEALASYEKAAALSGHSSYLYLKMGNLQTSQQDLKGAKRSFYRALRRDPALYEAELMLGSVYLLEGNKELAARNIERGLSNDAGNIPFRMLLCDIYVDLEMFQEAAVHYEDLMALVGENYLLYYNYAGLQEFLGDYGAAEELYMNSLKLSPNFCRGYLSLGRLYEKEGRTEDAEDALKRAVYCNPKDIAAYSLLVSLYLRTGEEQKAKTFLEIALGQELKFPEVYNVLGLIYLREEDYEKALEYFRNSVEVSDNSEARFYLGVVYDKIGRQEETELEMERALKLNPDNALALNYLGYSYLLADKKIERAYRLIKRACEIEPDNGAYLDSLGWAYFKMGNYPRAKKYLERAAELEQDSEIYEHLGHLYLELKDYIRAISWFIKAYEISGEKEQLEYVEKAKKMMRNGNN